MQETKLLRIANPFSPVSNYNYMYGLSHFLGEWPVNGQGWSGKGKAAIQSGQTKNSAPCIGGMEPFAPWLQCPYVTETESLSHSRRNCTMRSQYYLKVTFIPFIAFDQFRVPGDSATKQLGLGDFHA